MLRPTPPAVQEAVPGLLVRSTGAVAVRTLVSSTAPPTTTTESASARTRYPRPRTTPFFMRFDRCTDTAARVEPIRSAREVASSIGSDRSRATISRSRAVSFTLQILSTL